MVRIGRALAGAAAVLIVSSSFACADDSFAGADSIAAARELIGDFAGGSEDIVMAKTANANLVAQYASYGIK